MRRTAYLSHSSAYMLSPHTVSVLRRSNGDWTVISFGASVQPGEPIRLLSTDLRSGYLVFRLEDADSRVILEQSAGVNLALKGWIDIAAPQTEGMYYVYAVSSDVPFIQRPTHEIWTSFRVSEEAPAPPGPPGDGGPLDWLKEGKNILILLVILAFIVYVPKPRR